MAGMMSPDNGVQRQDYMKGSGGSKQVSMHTETDRISGGGIHGENTGPTGSPRSYPKGQKVDMSADFLPKATGIYVDGIGPSEGG